MEGLQDGFIKAAMHKRGLVGWVECPGQLLIGETFEIKLPPVSKNLWGD